MIKNSEWNGLHRSLTEAISGWWTEEAPTVNTPHVGIGLFDAMAEAALSVLKGIDDAQDSLEEEGLLKEEE